MKATELMVGDYIMFNGSPYIIEEISGKGWIHILDIKNKSRVALSSDYILDFIEGIPLTPKILEKNGFKYDKERTKDMRDLNSYSTIFFNFPLGEGFHIEWNTQNNVGVITDHCFVKFRYVHEFQHVLRLCNINKEIII